MRCLTLRPMAVRTQTTGTYRVVCGCDWSTPELNDLTTARQAHAAHVARRRERAKVCQSVGLHDRNPVTDRCRDCDVLLDESAPTCAPEPMGKVIA